MPRCQRIELADVAAWDNLEAALWLAARGKRARPDVAAFLANAQQGLQGIHAALLAGQMPEGIWRSFTIQDPKPRIIHAATRYVQAQMRARPQAWVLKLDVWHCFAQLPHAVVKQVLARRFKGSALGLVDAVLASHEPSPGSQRGLPIGALTSQHFANQVLGEIDRQALAHPACVAHVRYMDDVLLWVESRAAGQALAEHLQAWVGPTLGLQFKPPELRPVQAGVAFCGMRLGARGLCPGRRRMRAWASRCRALAQAVAAGALSDAAAQTQAEALRALCLPAQPLAWQRGVLKTLEEEACV